MTYIPPYPLYIATADRVAVSLTKLRKLGAKEVSVRTQSPNGYSHHSAPCRIPVELLEEKLETKSSDIPKVRYRVETLNVSSFVLYF